MSSRTSLTVKEETADRLYERKARTQSYDELLNELLDRTAPDAPAQ